MQGCPGVETLISVAEEPDPDYPPPPPPHPSPTAEALRRGLHSEPVLRLQSHLGLLGGSATGLRLREAEVEQ